MICNDCGNKEAFVQYQTVEEANLIDGDGEFVKVIFADTKDTHGRACYECESTDLSETCPQREAETGNRIESSPQE